MPFPRSLKSAGAIAALVIGLAACSQEEDVAASEQPPASSGEMVTASLPALDCSGAAALCGEAAAGSFPLIAGGIPAPVLTSGDDWPGVLRAAADLEADLETIAGNASRTGDQANVVVIGTIGQGGLVDDYIEQGLIDVSGIEGQWEAFTWQVIDNPSAEIERALVIAGSDKRGTIFGAYQLSDEAGVSPWNWWADVPVKHSDTLYVTAGSRTDMPEVKYRGIFLNDEEPALGNWVRDTYGDFNAAFYEDVFELILRLKGNYIWPAMWGKAIYDDDPASGPLADEMGIVLGTTHHEPLGRAHVEWDRYGEGDWNYDTNEEFLRGFWREGMERMGDGETIVTVGMRGDGDMAMSEGTQIELLERIVTDQRQIIEDVTGKPASETPQLWALYKEVQDYYDQGMEVPDDVTLLFADDNWGNIRRLPAVGAERPGGYGVYYHFDYVGGPRNYKWLSRTQISRVWEQMNLADEYGAKEIWIVNVGDLKPMEYPIDFFLDMAWDPDDIPLSELADYPEEWAAEQFGPEHAEEIARMMTAYTTYNSRRTAELLNASTYSLVNYDEFDRVTADYAALAEDADAMLEKLPPEYHDAYMQLVWHPIQAMANVYELYLAAAKNNLYAEQGRISANDYADQVADYFARDEELTRAYHEDIAGGKWNHMMSQTHIGYTYWQQPETQTPPETVEVTPVDGATIGVAVEGMTEAWPGGEGTATLPPLDPYDGGQHWIEVFNRSDEPSSFEILASESWLTVSSTGGTLNEDMRIMVGADWDEVPAGEHEATVTITGDAGEEVTVTVPVINPQADIASGTYIETDGIVSMEAVNASRIVDAGGITWKAIPDLGRTGDSLTTFPVTAESVIPGSDSPRLEFDIQLFEAGAVEVGVTMAPTLDFRGNGGLRYAVSIDDGAPQIVNTENDTTEGIWNAWVANYAIVTTQTLDVAEPGSHTVKVWMVDPGVVFQRVTVSSGEMPQAYLGPPESPRAE